MGHRLLPAPQFCLELALGKWDSPISKIANSHTFGPHHPHVQTPSFLWTTLSSPNRNCDAVPYQSAFLDAIISCSGDYLFASHLISPAPLGIYSHAWLC